MWSLFFIFRLLHAWILLIQMIKFWSIRWNVPLKWERMPFRFTWTWDQNRITTTSRSWWNCWAMYWMRYSLLAMMYPRGEGLNIPKNRYTVRCSCCTWEQNWEPILENILSEDLSRCEKGVQGCSAPIVIAGGSNWRKEKHWKRPWCHGWDAGLSIGRNAFQHERIPERSAAAMAKLSTEMRIASKGETEKPRQKGKRGKIARYFFFGMQEESKGGPDAIG